MVHVRENDRAVRAVKQYAEKLGFTVGDFTLTGSHNGGYLHIKPAPNAATIEAYFSRKDDKAPWRWCGAIHRVHWSDPIYKYNGSQPELDDRKAFKAYCALLAVLVQQEVEVR